MRSLRMVIANGHAPPSLGEMRTLVLALERQGLAVMRRGRVSLPD
jgi:hypothetical protein